MKMVIFRVKDGKLDQWRDWCSKLNTSLKSDALLTLEEERLLSEGAFLFQIEGKYYSVGFSESNGDTLLPKDSEINNTHRQMKLECLEKLENGVGEELYLLKK